MKVFHTFFCFLFIALQARNTGLVNAERLYTRLEGKDITVECQLPVSGSKKFFCRETCEGGNILIETTKNNDQSGRYSIWYEEGHFPSRKTIMFVSIKRLKMSDSGRYRCALEKSWFLEPQWDFRIIVKEDLTLGTFPPTTFLPSASTESSEQLDSSPPRSDLHLYVGLILVVKIFILSMPLMIFCKKRRSTKPKVPPVETIYVNISEPTWTKTWFMEMGQTAVAGSLSRMSEAVAPRKQRVMALKKQIYIKCCHLVSKW
ncbi:uncharacterized protein LOC129349442 isoform X2 [Amphiprion ocellaris]|uniref:uncharacterized protein LOC129349442 isoform X2 n=1 Tax=Amphiprion ocellaris TaxID=80972 RepID=UPI00241128D8|nr:uncharacterized protein LOC129349442 isoform X2 [Amphiprion ocellaris]